MGKNKKALSASDDVEDINIVIDELCILSDQIDSEYTALETKQQVEDHLNLISTLSQNSDNAEALLAIDDCVQMFGEDISQWESKINGILDPAEEGMKIQDFLRWGPFGLLMGLYLKKLTRIKNNLIQGKPKLDVVDFSKKRSLYLDPAKGVITILSGTEALLKELTKRTKDPSKTKVSDFDAMLKNMGIARVGNDPTDGRPSTDWKAVGGSLLLSFLGPVGTAIGGHVASDNGKPISERGWGKSELIKATDLLIKCIDLFATLEKELKQAKKSAGENKHVVKYMIKLLKTCKDAIQYNGRGLAAVVK